jgi:hypothetical protein
MDGYHFLAGFGYFNRKQAEECGRFAAETKTLVIQQIGTSFVLEIILLQKR